MVPPSPPTTPWQEDLHIAITPLHPVSALTPAPTDAANLAAGEAAGPHTNASVSSGGRQRRADLYEMAAKENPQWSFNPAYPPQPIWGFAGNTPDATTPGPTIFARYGQP